MPQKMFFKVTSAKAIENHFKENKMSTLLYIYVAQANDPKVPSFCLLFFETDNQMVLSDVKNRQNFILNELKKVNISLF